MFENTYTSHQEILKEWVPNNDCGGCYVSIRSYLDASFWTLLKDNLSNASSQLGRQRLLRRTT